MKHTRISIKAHGKGFFGAMISGAAPVALLGCLCIIGLTGCSGLSRRDKENLRLEDIHTRFNRSHFGVLRGDHEWALGELTKLREDMRLSDDIAPGVLYWQGYCYWELDRNEAAQGAFRELIELFPESVYASDARRKLDTSGAYGKLAKACTVMSQGDPDLALKMLRQLQADVRSSDKIAGDIIFQMGQCYEKMGKKAEACEQYEKLLANFPNSAFIADARKSRDALLQTTAPTTTPSTTPTTTPATAPTPPATPPKPPVTARPHDKAFQLISQGEFAQALKLLQELTQQIDPADDAADDVAFGIARCVEALRKTRDAITQYEKFIAAFPDSTHVAEAKRRTAELGLRRRYEKATFAISLDATDLAISTLVKLKSELKQTHPLAGDVGYDLACCYEKAGNVDQAITEYKEFLLTFPKSEHIADARASLQKLEQDATAQPSKE